MNRMTLVLLTLLSLFVFGCSAIRPIDTKECVPPTTPANNAAEVVVYRPHVDQMSAVAYGIAIDDCLIGDLADRSLIRYKLDAGSHKIWTQDAEIAIEFDPGTTSYVKFRIVSSGKVEFWFHGPIYERIPQFVLVNKATAEGELKSLANP